MADVRTTAASSYPGQSMGYSQGQDNPVTIQKGAISTVSQALGLVNELLARITSLNNALRGPQPTAMGDKNSSPLHESLNDQLNVLIKQLNCCHIEISEAYKALGM